jgi:hypothetical protein
VVVWHWIFIFNGSEQCTITRNPNDMYYLLSLPIYLLVLLELLEKRLQLSLKFATPSTRPGSQVGHFQK